MTFNDSIKQLAEQLQKRVPHVQGEEATKQALILPFIAALGYDVYDPTQVRPEYVADFAQKRGRQLEKVDYAICTDGQIGMFVEAKCRTKSCDAFDGQLARYFNSTPTARVGIVTNGVQYRFFTDLEQPNIMDKAPFFEFNVLDHTDADLDVLRMFHKDFFEANDVMATAEQLVYTRDMTSLVGELLREPNEPFIRFLVTELGYSSRITYRVVERFAPIVRSAIQASLVDVMTRSINQEIAAPVELARGRRLRTPAKPKDSTDAETAPQPAEVPPIVEVAAPVVPADASEDEARAFLAVASAMLAARGERVEGRRTAPDTLELYVGAPDNWVVRLVLNRAERRHLLLRASGEVVRAVLPDAVVFDAPAGTRVYITSAEEVERVAEAVASAFTHEELIAEPAES